jgi:hypothetical protein
MAAGIRQYQTYCTLEHVPNHKKRIRTRRAALAFSLKITDLSLEFALKVLKPNVTICDRKTRSWRDH